MKKLKSLFIALLIAAFATSGCRVKTVEGLHLVELHGHLFVVVYNTQGVSISEVASYNSNHLLK